MKKMCTLIVLSLSLSLFFLSKTSAQGCFDMTFCTDSTTCTATEVYLPYPPFFDLPCNVLPGATLTSDIPNLDDDGVNWATAADVPAGVYWATFIGVDDCGNQDTCTISVTVADCTAPQTTCITGLVVELQDGNPPSITLYAADFVLASIDNCPGSISYSFSETAPEPSMVFTCGDAGNQFLEIWTSDAAGNQSNCTVTLVVQTNDVDCCSGPTGNFAGLVQRDDQLGVEDVEVSCGDCPQTSSLTDADGAYHFDDLFMNCSYTFVPQKDGDDAEGLTILDVFRTRKHVLGLDPITNPSRLLAADVNQSNTVSTLDLVFMVKVILEQDPGFSEVDSWKFNPPFITINSLPIDPAQAAFLGIKMGDVLREEEVPIASVHPVFGLPTIEADLPGEVTASVKVKEFSQIEAFQMSISWDPSLLSLNGITSTVLSNFLPVNVYEPTPGHVNLYWFMTDGQQLTLADGAAILDLSFNTLLPGVSTPLTLFEDGIPFQIVAEGCKLVEDATVTSAKDIPMLQAFRVIQGANPLPVGGSTRIQVQSDRSILIKGMLTDAAGQIYSQVERQIPAGASSLELALPDAPGVYFLLLQAPGSESQTIKLVLL